MNNNKSNLVKTQKPEFCEVDACKCLADLLSHNGLWACGHHLKENGGEASLYDRINFEIDRITFFLNLNGGNMSPFDFYGQGALDALNGLLTGRDYPSDHLKKDMAAVVATHQDRFSGDIKEGE